MFQVYSKVIQLHIYIFSDSFHFRLLQDIEYSSVCYTVGLCCLSISYIVMCIYNVFLMPCILTALLCFWNLLCISPTHYHTPWRGQCHSMNFFHSPPLPHQTQTIFLTPYLICDIHYALAPHLSNLHSLRLGWNGNQEQILGAECVWFTLFCRKKLWISQNQCLHICFS